MKFNIEELHRSRLELETELKSIKPVLSKPHVLPESAELQMRKVYLRAKISFVYAALAYSRNRVHFAGLSLDEQAKWLIDQIAISKKQEEWANGPYGRNHPNKGFQHFFLLGESKKEAA